MAAQPQRRDEISDDQRQALTRLFEQPRPPTRGAHPPTVLIVDDDLDARQIYSQYLGARGFSTVAAQDGEAAIEVATRLRPNVIVMDLTMPRLDGIAATRRLKRDPRTHSIPVILLTGYPLRAIQEGASEAGVDVFLTKPCVPEELEHRLRRDSPREAALTPEPAKTMKRRAPAKAQPRQSDRRARHEVIRDEVLARAAARRVQGIALAGALQWKLPSLAQRIGTIPARRLPPPVTLRSAPKTLRRAG